MNALSQEELDRRMAALQAGMKSLTWRDLETQGKFTKNDKLTFISDDMLILGCDIGSETYYVRAIDLRARERSKDAFAFSNSSEGFQSAKDWVLSIAAEHNKYQIVLGLEPDRALLALYRGMDDNEWYQCCTGEPICSEADEGAGGPNHKLFSTRYDDIHHHWLCYMR